MNFKGDSIPEHFSLYGLEKDIKNAAINKGVEREKWIDIPVKDYKDMIYGFVIHAARTRMKGLFEIAEEMWKKCYMFGCMPIAKKMHLQTWSFPKKPKLVTNIYQKYIFRHLKK